jgi:hypothetical protein
MHYPFNPVSHYNKFGYYQVGQELTYSKWQAQKQSYQTKQPVQWIFNDEEYSKIDWTREPEISLTELYRIRAQQIRDRYDYVVVMYSGGADSHNALMSFLSNNIYVDEVSHMTELKGDRDIDSFANAEIAKVAWPEAEKLLNQYSPTTKHRTIDITDIILDLPNHLDDQEYITATSAWMTPGNLARSFLREKIPEYQEIISSGKKLCFVWGADKPLLATLYNRTSQTQYHAVTFSDRESCLVSPRQKYLNRSWEHDEFFYWSPDLPELVCKQAHLLKKMLSVPKHIAPSGHYGLDTTFSEFGWVLHDRKLSILSLNAGHSVIYPQWNPDTFSVGKTRSRVFSDRDQWLFKDSTTTSVGKMFQSVVELAQMSSNWRDNNRGWTASFSQLYPLENIPATENLQTFWPFESNF